MASSNAGFKDTSGVGGIELSGRNKPRDGVGRYSYEDALDITGTYLCCLLDVRCGLVVNVLRAGGFETTTNVLTFNRCVASDLLFCGSSRKINRNIKKCKDKHHGPDRRIALFSQTIPYFLKCN